MTHRGRRSLEGPGREAALEDFAGERYATITGTAVITAAASTPVWSFVYWLVKNDGSSVTTCLSGSLSISIGSRYAFHALMSVSTTIAAAIGRVSGSTMLPEHLHGCSRRRRGRPP